MRSSTPRDLSGVCPRCFLKVDLCLCSELTSIRSNIRIVIVRHVREERLTSKTGSSLAILAGVPPLGGLCVRFYRLKPGLQPGWYRYCSS